METFSHGFSAGSVDSTHEWISFDTPLQIMKVDGDEKTTMVPFHWVQRGKDNQDYETEKTL